jgi:hypothetical protein
MSNLSDAPGVDRYPHEMMHVWQNRLFGPFYTLTYIGWMVIWFIPGAIAGLIAKKSTGTGRVGLGRGIERWCYFNNPWEVWGYKVQGAARDGVAQGKELIWGPALVIVFGILICGGISVWAATRYLAVG